MLPKTSEQVPNDTPASLNHAIQSRITESVQYHAAHPQQIGGRLAELDREWDTERTLEANAATSAFVCVVLGATSHRRWLAVPALVTAFLFQHATQGWRPPLPVLRRLGFRTAREIDTERFALKALRGDFAPLGLDLQDRDSRARDALQAARL